MFREFSLGNRLLVLLAHKLIEIAHCDMYSQVIRNTFANYLLFSIRYSTYFTTLPANSISHRKYFDNGVQHTSYYYSPNAYSY